MVSEDKPTQELVVMFDYCSTGLWQFYGDEKGKYLVNIAGEDIGLSEELCALIVRWNTLHDSLIEYDNDHCEDKPHLEDLMEPMGQYLVKEVEKHLPDYKVTFQRYTEPTQAS